jgi:protein TonB
MKKEVLLFCLLLTNIFVWAQDTTYYDDDFNAVSSLQRATHYEVVVRDPVDTAKAVISAYYPSGVLKARRGYSSLKDGILDGKSQSWYPNGQIQIDANYKNGKKDGTLLTYWETGKPKRVDAYEADKLLSGKCFNSDGKQTVHFDFEIEPQFPGGINALVQYLAKETKYPNRARKNEVQGRVLVKFILNTDGSISNVGIQKGVDHDLDQEAIRVVKKMPKWSPGMEDGRAIKVPYILPVSFVLQ